MTDTAIIVPGSVEWLGQMTAQTFTATEKSRNRLWACRDEVARLERDLSAAQQRLATAEREHNANGTLLHEVWGQLRSELENAPRASVAQEAERLKAIHRKAEPVSIYVEPEVPQ